MNETVSEESERWAWLDPRSLGLFRVLLGLTLLLDLFSRFPHLRAFYTDRGVLPRALASEAGLLSEWLCLHLGTGEAVGQATLLGLQGLFALGLTVGWHTRWMTLGCWLLLNSLHVRNPFVNDRGDVELSLLLFWSFFLPLSERWSLDAATRRSSGRVDNKGITAAAFVLQIAQIYLWSGFLKQGEFWLGRGDGLYYSLQSPLFATKLSLWISSWPQPLLKLGNYAVITAEIFVGFLLLAPRRTPLLRGFAVLLLIVFHVAVALLFQLGLFPIIAVVATVALWPSAFWEFAPLRHLGEMLDRRLGATSSPGCGTPNGVKCLLATSIFLAALSSAANDFEGERFNRGSALITLTKSLRLEQHWDLFSPIPPYLGYFKIRTASDRELVWSCPSQEGVAESNEFPSHRWRMLMIASLYEQFAVVRGGLLEELRPEGVAGELIYQFQVRLVKHSGELGPDTVWTLSRQRNGVPRNS